jgi:hypothetical protein
VSGWGILSLAGKRRHVVCLMRSRSYLDLHMFHPVSLVLVRRVIVVLFLVLQAWCSPSDVLFSYNRSGHPVPKKKKNLHLASLLVVT